MKKKLFLKRFLNIEKRFFFNTHKKEQVNKIIFEYFYIEQKIHKIIDENEIRSLLILDKSNYNINGDISINKQKLNENFINEQKLEDNINNETFNENLKHIISKHISNYINSSKYFTHLCVFYIYNNEKKKFFELMKNFNNYCFGYEDLFILFYLICKINYKDMYVIRNILNVFEIYYYKINNSFSYSISNLFFYPYNNLYTAVNNLPLFYKIKLINVNKHYKKNSILQSHISKSILEKKKENDSINEFEKERDTKRKSINNENNISIEEKENGENFENIPNQNENVKIEEKRDFLRKVDETESENVLENLQDVDMEKYEKIISKNSVKFINLNIKNEKKNIQNKERKYEGLKLKSLLLLQIKNEVEKKRIDENFLELKEVLTIFIYDKELAGKNYYIKDFVNFIINYFITHSNMLSTNVLTLLVFMQKTNYYYNKKLNSSIENILTNYIKSMNLSEQDIYNFINKKIKSLQDNIKMENKENEKNFNILDFLFDQQYTYNFILFEDNIFYENKFQYVTNKLLKNYFFLISYILRLPFLKLYILKSYLNSFNMFINIFINNKNIFSYFDIREISFICTCFLKRKIIEVEIINKLFILLDYKINNFKKLLQKSDNSDIKHNKCEEANENVPFHINDILIFLHFLYYYNLKFEDLYKNIIMMCFNNFHFLNNTQKLIFFNSVEGMKKRNNMNEQLVLDYFMYDRNLQLFLNQNKNIQKDSLGFLFY
ncbi:conserved Plasmodium protein, unknown function [Plasmodium relictum]|uniref:Uncharacterized protein n=1 Tax=Plasmodium relictum TaxID=85471 RepID=A0A1J1HBZ2_PLARL|nr:conserved Plasmodium protein, unknown function [Plasmodium relictum]CRH00940.1 conserved Plasmodium protein, unknown function [Plasmodium relictum]